ncbi:GGDEF/EAL domain-containing response regulator [Thiohalorhabdus sp.]|uniref:GGDEF/EAL domain-containing response regulator n=1 Tax=Thiohalorhabdus sp. TaxID=3094134 RepID=UPI002FC29F70
MLNVMIVDDQSTDRQILAQLTANLDEGIHAEAFEEPYMALEWLRFNQPDLILVDYRLPGMDGLTFLKRCQELPSGEGVPVIVITVVQSSELRYQALQAGATDFLTKPLDVQECQARCRNLLTLRNQQLIIERDAERLAAARKRTGRALNILTLGSELLVRVREEQALVEGMCRVVMEQGGYPCVWVGLPEGVFGASIRVVASSVRDGNNGVADKASVPPETLLKVAETHCPLVLNDLSGEVGYEPWLAGLRGAGLGALIVLPVRIEGHANGVLAVFARMREQFDEDEMELLARTADNLGYGVAARRADQKRKQAEQDAENLAYYDRLTGLPNRTGLIRHLRALTQEGSESLTALLVINLDRFKLVDDTGGPNVGDMLLLQAVSRLKSVAGQGNKLARLSGDEFALLVPASNGGEGGDSRGGEASRLAERVIQAFRQPFKVVGFEYFIGASVGITTVENADEDLQRLLQQGNTALRLSKEAGGNTYSFYSGELTERHTQRLSQERRLHRAVENGDFVLHYQPIVRLEDARIVGAEALLRWPQEDGSLMGPDAFIPLSEEIGLMVSLGSWVFRTACEQIRAWNDAGHDLYVSINLSNHQLLSPSLNEDLVAAMDTTGAAPSRLELEVTEGAMMTDPPRTERILEGLHEQGLKIAVDDFGTGFSSLSRLKHLPISTLKIDKDFVLGLPGNPNDRTITQSITQLAANLGMRAVAEGVESESHREALMGMGCQFGQGFYFSAPRPGEEVREELAAGKKA